MNKGTGAEAVLSVLDYTKSDREWFDSRQLYAGYHSVSVLGHKVRGQRDPELRLAKVPYDFAGKRVLDVGCSNGGLLHALAPQIAFGVGVDFNSRCVNAANAIKAVNRTVNVHFYTFDLDKEDLSMLRHFVLDEPVDICLFLSLSLWVKRWQAAFAACARLAKTMVFEAHGSDQQQQEQLAYVRTVYPDVTRVSARSDDDPTYSSRQMFLCRAQPAQQGGDGQRLSGQGSRTGGAVTGTAASGFAAEPTSYLQVFDETSVRKAYESAFAGEEVRSIYFFPNTHESVVAEVNDAFIIKLPKPGRGVRGLEVERAVTDFIRSRVTASIPRVEIRNSPAVMARYARLPGKKFDSSRYTGLSEGEKDRLAQEIAGFMTELHRISPEEIRRESLPSAPSWELSLELIEEQLGADEDPMIQALLPQVVNNHRALRVPAANVVFGHFDLHGDNLLLDEQHRHLSAVLDFGNCKLGDLHQELSVMNLSSPDLAERVGRQYRGSSGREPNRLLVQHYTTLFYLNLLAELKRRKASGHPYGYWLERLRGWYEYLLTDRATSRLKARPAASSVSANWRRWVASNLMKGSQGSGLRQILRSNGFSDLEVATELALASTHPYVQAGQEIFRTLAKRNWLLRSCDRLASLDERYCARVEVRPTPSFEVFVREYYSKNLPVLLTGGADRWPALSNWSLEYFQSAFGEQLIEVQSGREQDAQYERNSGKHRKKMLMKEFVALVGSHEHSNDFYMTANNTRASMTGIGTLFDDVGDFGEGYRQSGAGHAGTFLWFGPRGTFTPLHHDLTNNMLVQIVGRKKVTLIPAVQVPWLYNDSGVYSAAKFPDFDEQKHPLMKNAKPLEIVVSPGEALFIPVGWWHCVEALDVSISVSFTNFNVTNQFSADYPR